MFAKLKHWYLIIILGIVGLMYYNVNQRLDYFEERLDLANGTISGQIEFNEGLKPTAEGSKPTIDFYLATATVMVV